MSTLTLVHTTSARLHGHLLSGSHVRPFRKVAARANWSAAGEQLCAQHQRRLETRARSEGQGRTMAVKRSRATARACVAVGGC